MKRRDNPPKAFTLIELLTVIAIIGILAALLFPAIKHALLQAEISKAQSAIVNLSTAFRSYYTEYGKWPITDTGTHTYVVDSTFVALLQGVNNPNPPQPTGPNEPPFGPLFNTVGSAKFAGNPRAIHFLDFKQADLDSVGRFVDPWKQAYYCRFDVAYANTIPNPYLNDVTKTITNGFMVWSAGPDGQYNQGGDLPPSLLNKDNVKSW